jgi:uncharacterized membrane protein YdjX (TVP38/TMEM64 family)
MRAPPTLRALFTSGLFYLVAGILVIGVVLVQWVEALGGPAAIWVRFGMLAPMISVPLHIVVAVTPLPSDIMGVANGAVYGFWGGFILTWVGWFSASFVQYAIGRRMRQDFDVEGWLARSPARLRHFPVGHPVFIIGARYVPYAGGHLATLLPGALGVDLFRFTWCTAIAIVPSSLVVAAVGAGLLLLG